MALSAHRLLVVEDDTCISFVLEAILRNAGFSVTIARDGKKAFDLIESGEFELILLDYQLPSLDGEQLCLKLRSDHRRDGTSVILVSSKVYELDIEDFKRRHGVSAVFSKPFSSRRLVASVEKALAHA